MCIIIAKLPGADLPEEHLANSYSNNSDGCGFAYISTDDLGVSKLKIKKSMSYDVFLRQYKKALKNHSESPFLIHFRYATHGTVDKFNCHPFKISKTLCMVHNGVIGGLPIEKNRSDTQIFNDEILKKLGTDWHKNSAIKKLLEKYLVGSKMVTLDINGHLEFYNEQMGHWKQGIWYSNTGYTYKKSPPKVTKYEDYLDYSVPEYYLCDGCDTMFPLKHCHFFKDKDGDPWCYCDKCKWEAIRLKKIKITDGISKYRYDIAMDDFYEQPPNKQLEYYT